MFVYKRKCDEIKNISKTNELVSICSFKRLRNLTMRTKNIFAHKDWIRQSACSQYGA